MRKMKNNCTCHTRRARVFLAAAALLALGMTSCASAQTSVETVTEGLSDVSGWITGSDLLTCYADDGRYAICGLDGVAVVRETFSRVGYAAEYGYLTLAQENGTLNDAGVYDLSGAALIPMEYGNIEVLSRHWILCSKLEEAAQGEGDIELWDRGTDTVYATILSTDVWYVGDDGAAAMVGTLERSEYLRAWAYGSNLNVENRDSGEVTAYDETMTPISGGLSSLYDESLRTDLPIAFYEDGHYGLQDLSTGEVLLEATYDYIGTFYGDYAEVVLYDENYDASCGLIDRSGALVLPVEFEDILLCYALPQTAENDYASMGYEAYGYFCVVQDGKIGYAVRGGQITCAPTLAEENLDNNGASAYYTADDGTPHILSATGTDTAAEGLEWVNTMYGDGGLYYECCTDEWLYGVIDWQGDTVLANEYAWVELSGSGQYLLASKDYATVDILKLTPDLGETGSGTVSGHGTAGGGDETEAPGAGAGAGETEEAESETAAEPESEGPVMYGLDQFLSH